MQGASFSRFVQLDVIGPSRFSQDIFCYGAPWAEPVPARRSAPLKYLASKSFGTQAWSSA
jgi:hypothetical protein